MKKQKVAMKWCDISKLCGIPNRIPFTRIYERARSAEDFNHRVKLGLIEPIPGYPGFAYNIKWPDAKNGLLGPQINLFRIENRTKVTSSYPARVKPKPPIEWGKVLLMILLSPLYLFIFILGLLDI
jgi:hypothetical protein